MKYKYHLILLIVFLSCRGKERKGLFGSKTEFAYYGESPDTLFYKNDTLVFFDYSRHDTIYIHDKTYKQESHNRMYLYRMIPDTVVEEDNSTRFWVDRLPRTLYFPDSILDFGLVTHSVITIVPLVGGKFNHYDVELLSDAIFKEPSGYVQDSNRLFIKICGSKIVRKLKWDDIYQGSPDMPLPLETKEKSIYVMLQYMNRKWNLTGEVSNF